MSLSRGGSAHRSGGGGGRRGCRGIVPFLRLGFGVFGIVE